MRQRPKIDWDSIDHTISMLLSPDSYYNAAEYQRAMLNLFGKLCDQSLKWEEILNQQINDNNNLVLDLEHIVGVGSDKISMQDLPERLRNLTREEYLEELASTVSLRRGQKDMAAVYRTINQRCSNIVNFISGMDKRKYEIRYKNPKFGQQSQTGSVAGPDSSSSKKIAPQCGTANNVHVTIKTKEEPKADSGSAGYASRSYPR